MNRRSLAQPNLFETPSCARRLRKEQDDLYDAVLKLRRQGYRVYRAGRDTHLLNGRRVSSLYILAFVATKEWRAPLHRHNGPL
jgi:hypothetical protein